MDGGTTGLLVNLGNQYMTGRWWEVGACPGTDSDRTPRVSDQCALYASLAQLLGPKRVRRGPDRAARGGTLAFVRGPVCNVRGLTSFGEYLINRMIDKGMIVEADHLSVRGAPR